METVNTNQQVPPAQNTEPSQAPPPNPPSHSKIFIIVLSVVLVLMLGIGNYILGTRKNQTVLQNQLISTHPTIPQPSPTPTVIISSTLTPTPNKYSAIFTVENMDTYLTYSLPYGLIANSSTIISSDFKQGDLSPNSGTEIYIYGYLNKNDASAKEYVNTFPKYGGKVEKITIKGLTVYRWNFGYEGIRKRYIVEGNKYFLDIALGSSNDATRERDSKFVEEFISLITFKK